MMQIQYTKNLNPGGFELGTTLSWAEQVYWTRPFGQILFKNTIGS